MCDCLAGVAHGVQRVTRREAVVDGIAVELVDRRTKVVVFADSSHRYAANRGQRSTAEKLAKYLGKKIKQDEKKAVAKHPI